VVVHRHTPTTKAALDTPCYLSRNSNCCRTTAVITLRSHNLIIMRTQRHPKACPRIEVARRGDGAASPFAGADRPVLLECGSTYDGRLVCAGGGEDVVGAAVAGDGPFLRSGGRRIIGSVVFCDVVFNQGALGPAVDRQVAVAVGAVGSRVRDRSVKVVSL
jgi:hypothetical protein